MERCVVRELGPLASRARRSRRAHCRRRKRGRFSRMTAGSETTEHGPSALRRPRKPGSGTQESPHSHSCRRWAGHHPIRRRRRILRPAPNQGMRTEDREALRCLRENHLLRRLPLPRNCRSTIHGIRPRLGLRRHLERACRRRKGNPSPGTNTPNPPVLHARHPHYNSSSRWTPTPPDPPRRSQS
jgi:hypothetical protein